ncbi:MAG: hypothetical protein ABI051_00910 [Vicinamibacterales bacterium]
MNVVPLIALLIATVLSGTQTYTPDADGFIRNWLVLAPIAVEEDSGATEIDKDLVNGEAAIKPKAGDKVSSLGTTWTWTPHTTSDYFIDFRESFGKDRGEDAAAYAVAYVISDADMTVKLSMGSNDQFKAWLNGKQVLRFGETRTLEKDTDTADVTLLKGQNVLVFKVINEKNSWQGCARFTKDGVGVKNLRISVAPQ